MKSLSPTSESAPPAPSWWENPTTFGTRLAAFNHDQKVLGESELPPDVRDYLTRLENAQHAEASDLPTKR